MLAPELSLLIPQLLGAPAAWLSGSAAEPPRLNALERMLARSDAAQVNDEGLDAALFRLFGIAAPPRGDLPVAPLTLRFDTGAPVSGYWLRADPVHLRAGQDKVVMGGDAMLQVGQDEADALCGEINDHLAAREMRLIAPVGTRWYLGLPEAPATRFSPLDAVIGRDIYPYLPQGQGGREWRRLLNEIQMLLHASEVNQKRVMQGQAEINSVWFWGGGELPPAGTCRFSRVWAGHPLAGGLALNANLAPLPPPADAAAWLAAAAAGRDLVVLDGLQQPAKVSDVEGWCDGMRMLIGRWIEPLCSMLRDNRLGALTIVTVGALEYHVTPKLMRRWWRRPKPYTAYAESPSVT